MVSYIRDKKTGNELVWLCREYVYIKVAVSSVIRDGLVIIGMRDRDIGELRRLNTYVFFIMIVQNIKIEISTQN